MGIHSIRHVKIEDLKVEKTLEDGNLYDNKFDELWRRYSPTSFENRVRLGLVSLDDLNPPIINTEFTVFDGHRRIAEHKKRNRKTIRCIIVTDKHLDTEQYRDIGILYAGSQIKHRAAGAKKFPRPYAALRRIVSWIAYLLFKNKIL